MGRRLDDRATAEIFFPSPYRKVSDHSQFASHWAAVATKRLAVLCVGVHARFLSFLFRSAAFLVRALAAAFDALVAISLRRSADSFLALPMPRLVQSALRTPVERPRFGHLPRCQPPGNGNLSKKRLQSLESYSPQDPLRMLWTGSQSSCRQSLSLK
jgi:hypothetical protein